MKRLNIIYAFCLVAVVVVLYAHTIGVKPFLWDDRYLIQRNPLIREMSNLPELFNKKYFSQEIELSYRPVGTFTLMLNHALSGTDTRLYRATNIFLHAAGVLLLFFLAQALFRRIGSEKNSLYFAFGVAAIFAVHPVNTETINGITFREDLLVFVFLNAAFLAYLKQTAKNKNVALFISTIFFTLAVFSKETAIVFPAVLVAYEFLFNGEIGKARDQWKNILVRLWPFAMCGLFYLIVRFALLRNPNELMVFHGHSLWTTLLLTGNAWMRYLSLAIFPLVQCFDYTYPDIPSGMQIKYVLSLISLIGFLALPWMLIKKSRAAAFGLFWYILFLLPVSNILPIGVVMAERYLYIPIAGLIFTCAVMLIPPLNENSGKPGFVTRWRFTIILLVGIYFSNSAALTAMRNSVWRDDIVFLRQTTACAPASPSAWINLGLALDESKRPNEAIKALSRAITLAEARNIGQDRYGTIYRAHGNLGMVLAKTGKFEEAAKHLAKALQIEPGYTPARYNIILLIRNCRALAAQAEQKMQTKKALEYYYLLQKIDPASIHIYQSKISELSTKEKEK